MIKSSLSLIKNNQVILRGGMFFFGLRMLQMVLGFAVTYVLVRTISVEQYGQYSFVIGVIGFLSVFSLTEMNNAVMQSIARGFYGTYLAAIKKTLRFCLLGMIIFLGLSAFYLLNNQTDISIALLGAGLIFPLYKGLNQWKSLKIAEHKFGELTRIEGLNSLITNFTVIVLTLVMPGNFLLPLFGLLLIPSLRNVISVITDLRKMPSTGTAEEGSIEYGLKTSFISSLGQMAVDLDRIILFFFLSPSAVALFVAADRLSDIFKSITQDISAVMAPKLAKQKTYTKKIDTLFMLYGIAMGSALIIFSFTLLPYIFTLIFGQPYAEAIPYAQALMCSTAVGNFSIMRFRYVRSQMDIKGYRNITLGSAIVRIVSLLVLVPVFGIWGAVSSAFIYRITTSILVSQLIKKNGYISAT